MSPETSDTKFAATPQSNPGGIQIDRKRLEELMEKREAHGLKGNVYEEYRGPTMGGMSM